MIILNPNPCFDVTFWVRKFSAGSIQRSYQHTYLPGGKGVNVARACKKLDYQTHLIILLPQDEGDHFQKLFSGENIKVSYHMVNGEVRKVGVIYPDDPHDTTLIVGNGPKITEQNWIDYCRLTADNVSKNELVLEMGSMPDGFPDNALDLLLSAVHAKGGKLLVDTSPVGIKSLKKERLDFIKPNLEEAEAILSDSIGDFYKPDHENVKERAIQAAEKLYEKYADVVLVTAGASGVALKSREKAKWLPALEVPTYLFKSAVGAGDTFLAGFASHIEKNEFKTEFLEEAIYRGMAAAAAQCENYDPGEFSMPRFNEYLKQALHV
jgi:1-phosphofructokinase family hexose kinase